MRGDLDTPGVHAPAGGVIGQPTRQQIIANDLPVPFAVTVPYTGPEVSLVLTFPPPSTFASPYVSCSSVIVIVVAARRIT